MIHMDSQDYPLVSILIPSYKPRHFEIALTSALAQTYPNREIIVSDDCPTEEIAQICAKYPMVNYSRNPRRAPNTNLLRLIGMAQGEYVKYLLDDDLLHPLCVTQMVDAMQAHETAMLVFSPRDIIDDNNRVIRQERHIPTTKPLLRIVGTSLIKHCVTKVQNVIGEFSTVLFRRADVFDAQGQPILTSYHGTPVTGLTDIATWLQLCERGEALYLADPLSCFRIHAASNTSAQTSPGYRAAVADWAIFVRHAFTSPEFTVDERRVSLKRMKSLLERKLQLFPDLSGELADIDRMLASVQQP
jgi:glycosyltransferase involved in cell wall biosynthesis